MTEHYLERINKILFYIDENLDSELSLEKIADIGCYSPFHLHRLFKAITGETLNSYITRKRIEKIAFYLMHRKEVSITELSTQFGFNSNTSLTRSFTRFYGMSPSSFRNQLPGQYSKIGKVDSKNGQEKQIFEQYVCNINNCINYMKTNAKIEIKQLPAMRLAYLTQIGVDGLEGAFGKMMAWARKKRLTDDPDFKFIRIFHDSLKVTSHDKVRMSICVPVDDSVEVGGEVGAMTLEKGKYLVVRFEITVEDFGKSWESTFVWMNENGHQKADRDPFEILYNNPDQHPEKKCVVDFCIPIK